MTPNEPFSLRYQLHVTRQQTRQVPFIDYALVFWPVFRRYCFSSIGCRSELIAEGYRDRIRVMRLPVQVADVGHESGVHFLQTPAHEAIVDAWHEQQTDHNRFNHSQYAMSDAGEAVVEEFEVEEETVGPQVF